MTDTTQRPAAAGLPPTIEARDTRPGRAQLVERHLRTVLGNLQEQYLAGSAPTAWAQATLAKLRSGDINDPGATPTSWQLVFEGLPTELTGRGDGPSKGELVIHQALTLYAVHAQGRRPNRMHVDRRSLGRAARDLAWIDGGLQPNAGVLSRFHRLSTTNDPTMRIVHLRSMITMLRAQRVALDYALLGHDLYRLLHPATRTDVQLAWARDFHHRPPKDTTAKTATSVDADQSSKETQS